MATVTEDFNYLICNISRNIYLNYMTYSVSIYIQYDQLIMIYLALLSFVLWDSLNNSQKTYCHVLSNELDEIFIHVTMTRQYLAMEHYINLHSNNCDYKKQMFLLNDKLYTLLFVCVIIVNEPRHININININMINFIASFNNITSNTSRYILLSIYTKQTDIIKRYDNFSVNLLGNNINVEDQFTIWKIQLLDIPTNTNNVLQHFPAILFILSYVTLIERYSIKYKLPLITPFIKMKRLQSKSTTFKCMHVLLQTFTRIYYNMHRRCDNGETEQFNSKLIHYNKFDELINEIGIIFNNVNLFQSLKNGLFLPNLIVKDIIIANVNFKMIEFFNQ